MLSFGPGDNAQFLHVELECVSYFSIRRYLPQNFPDSTGEPDRDGRFGAEFRIVPIEFGQAQNLSAYYFE